MRVLLIYFITIFLSNTVGALSGMGGGVIIKPVLDFLGFHSLNSIAFYSSFLSAKVYSTASTPAIRAMTMAMAEAGPSPDGAVRPCETTDTKTEGGVAAIWQSGGQFNLADAQRTRHII